MEILKDLISALETNNVTATKMVLDSFAYSFYNNAKERFNSGNITEGFVNDLRIVLQALDFVYISGEISPLSDSEYDELHEIYNTISGDVITNKYEPSGTRVKHLYPNLKGTLEKVHYVKESDKPSNAIKTHKSLETWVINALAKTSVPCVIACFPKYDGISVVMSFENGKLISAITRGDKDTNMGKDVTNNFKYCDLSEIIPEELKSHNKIGIKTEVCMTKHDFEIYSEKYKTESRKLNDPRSCVSGLVNATDLSPELSRYLYIIPLAYATESEISFPSSDCFTVINDMDIDKILEDFESMIEMMKEKIEKLPVCCDGLVFRFTDKRSQYLLGRDVVNSVNKFEIAFKFPPEEKETTLIDVEFQIGLLGNVTPVAKIQPVKIKNRIIKSISLGSIDRMESLNLHLGDKVLVKYEIIPYMTKLKDSGNTVLITRPTHCPYCHELLVENPVLTCNNKSCPSRIMGKIDNYCDKMNIKGLGSSIIETLFNAGVLRSIEDLYRLKSKKEFISNLPGFGSVKFDNMIKAIEDVSEVPDYILLGSIGIKSIGLQKMKKISNIYYIYDILKMDPNSEEDINKLTEIPSIGRSTAITILSGIQENKNLIEFLMNKIKLIRKDVGEFNIVFSGVRNRELSQHLENLGFEIKNTVNKNTKAVIVKDSDTNTEKVRRAAELNIPVFDLVTAYKVFNF